MHRAVIRLRNASFYAHHGVFAEEHTLGGRYEIDLDVELDISRAAETDALSHTVDYERLYGFVRQVVLENRFFLLERLAYRIAHAVLEEFPQALSVEVRVRKPNPPVGGVCDYAEVIYRCPRPTSA
ncbi:MAG: dihydroneopterin aldolase [Bacteroidetes bacterium]|nr:dihydroneopterin aldolase [Rhodothermia bacterium]MCS7154339.1 dihydroneopterin aldolase [Bacteroidota bacterium]MCX7906624.1 dihydroneopterin aldolase [Bacteroidota bacterium]MDW8137095.1 dihydroneopterin aldolase [Bacteroidota bacterium]MDW8285034.1 dihydroneopterin aldolase [Bacteroidota bacterium]